MANYRSLESANAEIDRLRKEVSWLLSERMKSASRIKSVALSLGTAIWNIEHNPRSWDRPSEEWLPSLRNMLGQAKGGG